MSRLIFFFFFKLQIDWDLLANNIQDTGINLCIQPTSLLKFYFLIQPILIEFLFLHGWLELQNDNNWKVTDQFWNIITEINQAITVQSQTTNYKMQHII